jgi:hypothetical protein
MVSGSVGHQELVGEQRVAAEVGDDEERARQEGDDAGVPGQG